MQQLSEMDSNFLQQESARTPMHISPVIIYDQSEREGGKVRYQDILTVFERNLHKSVIFRRKLAGGAMGLDTPYWVEDEGFDLEFHVRHLALPKPGDWRQFCILLARLQARGLDMKRPLWEAYVIEGLNKVEGVPPNSFALMLKIHHSAIDGISGAEIVTAIHSLSDEIAPPVVDTWRGESAPSTWKVWSRAYLHNLRRPVKFVETISKLVPAVVNARQLSANSSIDGRKTLSAKTRFNARISSNRVTDALIMDLAEVKSMRKALNDVTINDIVVAVIGGALRKYLQAKDELPESSLIAGAPVNVRSEQNSESSGNQVSLMRIDMATNVTDPVERLQAVHESAQQSKIFSNAMGASVMMDISEILIPQVLGWGFRAATMAAARTDKPIPCHVIISNVPGSQIPLYLAGAKVHLMMGLGPLLDLMGLFHAVLSGAGRLTINFICCREMMPDPQFYKTCLEEAYEELKVAARDASPHVAASGNPKEQAKEQAKSKPKTSRKSKKKVAKN
jgi:diacylglycerol O-acyltransferase